MYIYARYTRPASELNCLRFNLSELLKLWQRTSCGNLQGNLFYDNPIQSMHSRWFQNLVIHLSITIWKFLNSETFYYTVDPVNPTLTKRFTLGSLFITLRQLSSLGLSLIDFLFQVSQDIHDCLLPGHSSFGDILKQPSWNESSRRDFSESKGWQT